MNNFKKTSVRFFMMLLILLFSLTTLPFSAQAGTLALPSVSERSYLEVLARKNISVYRDSSLRTRGTVLPYKRYNASISSGDTVYVYSISSYSCYISYPTSSGRRRGYCSTTELFYRNCCDLKITSQGSCTVYKSYSGWRSYGSISRSDSVWIIGKGGDMLFVIYTARSGNRAYKAGWITMNSYRSSINPPAPSPSSAKTYYVKTNGASLILRSGPSSSSSRLASMPNGAKVAVYSITNGWARLSYNGTYGYASSSYLSTSAPSASDDAVADAAKRYGIPASSNAYKALQSIYSKYKTSIAGSGPCVFLFEGVGNSSSSNARKNAMVVIVKNQKIVYINRNSSTLPDYPFTPGKNGNSPMPTVKDGIYQFTTTNHKGSYAALHITNPGVVRFRSKSSFYNSTSNAINVHQRSTDTIAPSNRNWVNSAGCQLVGLRSEYLNFLKAIGIVNASCTSVRKYQNYVSGTIVIDRSYGYGYMSRVGYSDSAIRAIRGY